MTNKTPYEQGYTDRRDGLNAYRVGFAIMAIDYLGWNQAVFSGMFPDRRDYYTGWIDSHYDLAAEMS